MDLNIEGKRYIICGASSGFGKAVALALLNEGAEVVPVARRGDELKSIYGNGSEFIEGSVIYDQTLDSITESFKKRKTYGILFNAGGPPAGGALESEMADWDAAWKLVMRWKIDLALRLAPEMKQNKDGRMLFVESQSIKQPIPNLVLSNAFRAGIAGFAKTLSQELAASGVTVNILAPGSHETPAIDRIVKNRAALKGITEQQSKEEMKVSIPVGRLGTAEEFASLALWLLSPMSGYVTGQVISHDGGSVAGLMG